VPTTNHVQHLDDGTAVAIVLDDEYRVRQVRFTAPYGGNIDGPTLRALPLGRIVAGVAASTMQAPSPADAPSGHARKPDEFYEGVAALFLRYASETSGPAQRVAEQYGVPVTTVHRWVREARRRGLLRLGERG
jgi:hypothetical protein